MQDDQDIPVHIDGYHYHANGEISAVISLGVKQGQVTTVRTVKDKASKHDGQAWFYHVIPNSPNLQGVHQSKGVPCLLSEQLIREYSSFAF